MFMQRQKATKNNDADANDFADSNLYDTAEKDLPITLF